MLETVATGEFFPTEFEEHVQLFDKTFKCYPLTRDQMKAKLNEQACGDYFISDTTVDFVMSLQKRAFFGLRLALLIEETGEWCEAFLKEKPVVEQENEVADMEYVLHGLNDTLGYDANAARGRVAFKNHKKIRNAVDMHVSDTGKIIKPEDINANQHTNQN